VVALMCPVVARTYGVDRATISRLHKRAVAQ